MGIIQIGSILAFFLVRNADTWGRKRILTITILGYTVCTLLTGLSQDVYTFAAAQLAAKFFLVTEWAVGMVYAAEEFPAARRGMVIGVLNGLNGLGAVVCAGVAPLIVKMPLGWRGVYFVGAIPLLLMAIARRSLRETRRFTEHVAGTDATKRSFWQILEPPYRNRMLTLALLWALTFVSTNVAITFWKEHAILELGISDAEAGANVAIAAVAAMPLAFCAGKLIDRVGQRVGSLIIYGATILGTLGAYELTSRWLIVASLVAGVAGITAIGAPLGTYTAELFPTRLRSDAFGWSNHLLGRITLVLSPAGVGYAAERIGWSRAVSLTTICLAAAAVLILLLMPETRGRELEETSGQAA